MSAAHGATGYGLMTGSTRRIFSLVERYRGAFQERRKQARLRAVLFELNDRELMDIGITRHEIDYVAANRSTDPRGIDPVLR